MPAICRSCHHEGMSTVLDLGLLPVPEPLLPLHRLDRSDPMLPLKLLLCRRCLLLQAATRPAEPPRIRMIELRRRHRHAAGTGGGDPMVADRELAGTTDAARCIGQLAAALPRGRSLSLAFPWPAADTAAGAWAVVRHVWSLYPTIASLRPLLALHRLYPRDAEMLPGEIGWLRLEVGRTGASSPGLARCEAREWRMRLHREDGYRDWAAQSLAISRGLGPLLDGLRRMEKRIIGLGTGAGALLMLSHAGVERGTIEYLVDRTPEAAGHWTPGLRIPVLSSERLAADRPDYLLLLNWRRPPQPLSPPPGMRERGGFILPVPRPAVISAAARPRPQAILA